MKVFSIILSMAGFILMMAGVGTIEADNSITGFELVIWGLISMIGVLTWISGILLWQSQR